MLSWLVSKPVYSMTMFPWAGMSVWAQDGHQGHCVIISQPSLSGQETYHKTTRSLSPSHSTPSHSLLFKTLTVRCFSQFAGSQNQGKYFLPIANSCIGYLTVRTREWFLAFLQ